MSWYDMSDPPLQYDLAQFCQNGHLINEYAGKYPYSNENFCSKCGAATITACPNCDAPLRGATLNSGVIGISSIPTPDFCYQCGQTYPWTAAKLAAARELADELENLSDEDREKLKAALPDLIHETPRSEVAVLQTKRTLAKAGGEAKAMFLTILRELAREEIKKTLGL